MGCIFQVFLHKDFFARIFWIVTLAAGLPNNPKRMQMVLPEKARCQERNGFSAFLRYEFA
jgi:hypothetical protein